MVRPATFREYKQKKGYHVRTMSTATQTEINQVVTALSTLMGTACNTNVCCGFHTVAEVTTQQNALFPDSTLTENEVDAILSYLSKNGFAHRCYASDAESPAYVYKFNVSMVQFNYKNLYYTSLQGFVPNIGLASGNSSGSNSFNLSSTPAPTTGSYSGALCTQTNPSN